MTKEEEESAARRAWPQSLDPVCGSEKKPHMLPLGDAARKRCMNCGDIVEVAMAHHVRYARG